MSDVPYNQTTTLTSTVEAVPIRVSSMSPKYQFKNRIMCNNQDKNS